MAATTYALFEKAMRARKQVLCTYQGAPREVCPIILGHTKGAEQALTWQFGGTDKKGAPIRGQWKCLTLADVSDVRLRDGPWHAGKSHMTRQTCVEDVDLDMNPDSPYSPRRRL
jgi:hypothetical protein